MTESVLFVFFFSLCAWIYSYTAQKRQSGEAITLRTLWGPTVLTTTLCLLLFLFINIFPSFFLWGMVYSDIFCHLIAIALVLTVHQQKRKWHTLITALFLLASFFLSYSLGLLRSNNSINDRVLIHSIQIIYIFVYLFASIKEPPRNILMSWVIIIVSRELSMSVFGLLMNLVGQSDLVSLNPFALPAPWDMVVLWSVRFIVLFIVRCLFNSKIELSETRSIYWSLIFFCCWVFFLSGPLYALQRVYLEQCFSLPLSIVFKLLYISIYLFILIERSGLLRRSQLTADLAITEQLLYQEKSHYLTMRENVDAINAKCHDLKHQLDQLQGRLTDNEIAVLKDAVDLYDSHIKTGSEVFDILIYQKRLYCNKHGISFTYMVDGKILNFMSRSRLYALLNNILENAMEAAIKVVDPEKKVINLILYRQGNDAILEVSNYFSGELDVSSLTTSKNDKTHHGFGIKSIRYILAEYHGQLLIKTEDDIFTLTARIPLPPA